MPESACCARCRACWWVASSSWAWERACNFASMELPTLREPPARQTHDSDIECTQKLRLAPCERKQIGILLQVRDADLNEGHQSKAVCSPVSVPLGLKSSPSSVMQRVRTSLLKASALALLES